MPVARNFGELRTDFLALLNRNDCTQAQADQFVRDGINRTNRVLGQYIPAFEKEATLTADANGRVTIPTDFLSVIDFIDPNGTNAEYVAAPRDRIKHERLQPSLTTGLTQAQLQNTNVSPTRQQPTVLWTRRINQFEFYPELEEGDTVTLLYRADPVVIDSDDDFIPILLFAPEAAKYASLIYAADFFQDAERQRNWAEIFSAIAGEIKDQHETMVMDDPNITMHSFRPDETF